MKNTDEAFQMRSVRIGPISLEVEILAEACSTVEDQTYLGRVGGAVLF